MIDPRPGDRADLLGDVGPQHLAVAFADLDSLAQGHEGDDRLARRGVGRADDRRLGDARVVDEGGLDLGRRDAVARDVHDVVDPAEQPQVPVLVELGPVAGEVAALESAPVGLLVALGVAVDPAQHRRPRRG